VTTHIYVLVPVKFIRFELNRIRVKSRARQNHRDSMPLLSSLTAHARKNLLVQWHVCHHVLASLLEVRCNWSCIIFVSRSMSHVTTLHLSLKSAIMSST